MIRLWVIHPYTIPGPVSQVLLRLRPTTQVVELIEFLATVSASDFDCTAHAPQIAGGSKPDHAHLLDFVQSNRRVRYYQTNTAPGNDLFEYFGGGQIELLPSFISMLKNHHELESEVVAGSQVIDSSTH